MKKVYIIILFGALIITSGCNKDDEPTNYEEESYLPMHIGNYWKNNEENYTEIIDTTRIEGNLYYKFYSLLGGDMVSERFLRIDHNNILIESHPKYPDNKFIHAKFNAEIGSTFWTINDQSVNDYKATVIEKDISIRSFEFQRVYHPTIKDAHTKRYVKGLGWDIYKEVKINGHIYNF